MRLNQFHMPTPWLTIIGMKAKGHSSLWAHFMWLIHHAFRKHKKDC